MSRLGDALRAVSAAVAVAAGSWAAVSTSYLLALLLVARLRGARAGARSGATSPERLPRLLVLVPAHDEEGVIGDAVRALLAARYPPERRQLVVVADNCSDATAAVAAAAGAEVWERHDREQPGKGQAIAWALARVADHPPDAVVMVDADCAASDNLLLALGEAIADGADAVQSQYVVSNPTAAPAAALRDAGFALWNTLRPLAKDRLGLSAGLLGTGMAFPTSTLSAVPWEAFSVTEDREYHMRLLQNGMRVRFAERAAVASPMPTTHAGGAAQQLRWDTGNALLARRFAPGLLAYAARRGSLTALDAAVDLLIPPQTLLSGLAMAALGIGMAVRSRTARRVGAASLAGQAVYVLGGLRLVGAPPAVFRALAGAPWLIARRLSQHARIAVGRGSRIWMRTDRARPAPDSDRAPDRLA